MARPIVVWFRNDLRTTDHPALAKAGADGTPVIPLYVLDDETPADWSPGGASRWWLHHSLHSLARQLESLGPKLVLRRGPAVGTVAAIARDVNAAAVHCSRTFEPWARADEEALRDELATSDIAFRRYAGTLLHDPDEIKTKAGAPYKVYTPFWRAVEASQIRTCRPGPDKLTAYRGHLDSDSLSDWRLLPTKPDWAAGFADVWDVGEGPAERKLAQFVQNHGANYKDDRDRPDLPATSRLSPHLHFGEISPAQCWHAALAQEQSSPATAKGLETFRKELVWREFSHHLLYHWPTLPTTSFRANFERFPWQPDSTTASAHLQAWQKGQTGYPIIDAGMRELLTTGWMHNRVRMVVASFLTKHLRIHWREGETWFWDCLVDADLAANAASWQWVAGSGADAAPYFRIFNPITQGQKFDPNGDYVRRWVPEIAALPTSCLHAPWTASNDVLARANLSLGVDYPMPIVDHSLARERALSAYEVIKATG